jgi:hypothetical protein
MPSSTHSTNLKLDYSYNTEANVATSLSIDPLSTQQPNLGVSHLQKQQSQPHPMSATTSDCYHQRLLSPATATTSVCYHQSSHHFPLTLIPTPVSIQVHISRRDGCLAVLRTTMKEVHTRLTRET